MVLIILLILAVVALGGGGWGYTRPRWGYASFSPLALVAGVIVVLLLLGAVR
jgi:ABC-type methionine transport system permease subunit